jgi:hypothetical protein
LITKPTQIEFGNLSRGANNPLLIKEKTDENGDTILRIYQRKNLQSITSPFEKIKNALKYTLEDFGREHKTIAKLMEKIGFGKVRELKTAETEKAVGLIETIRSGARTGFIDEKSKAEFDNILHDNKIEKYDGFNFYKDTYSDQNFEKDLEFISKKNSGSSLNLLDEFKLLKGFIDRTAFDEPLKNSSIFNLHIKKYKDLRTEVKNILKNNNTERQLQNEFLNKLEKILYQPTLFKLGAENTKNWLLKYEENTSKVPGNAGNQDSTKDKNSVIHDIKSAFSNHWWDSDEKKTESLIALYYRYANSDESPRNSWRPVGLS